METIRDSTLELEPGVFLQEQASQLSQPVSGPPIGGL